MRLNFLVVNNSGFFLQLVQPKKELTTFAELKRVIDNSGIISPLLAVLQE